MSGHNLTVYACPGEGLVLVDGHAFELVGVVAVVIKLNVFALVGVGCSEEFVEYQLGEVHRRITHGDFFLIADGCITSLIGDTYHIGDLGAVGLSGNCGCVGFSAALHVNCVGSTVDGVFEHGLAHVLESGNGGRDNDFVNRCGRFGSNGNLVDGRGSLVHFIFDTCCQRQGRHKHESI